MSDGTPKQTLPRFIDPRRFGQQGVALRGAVPAAEMHRLAEVAIKVNAVSADLAFAIDDHREKVVKGKLLATVHLQCQRCLEPMPVDLTCDVDLVVVRDEAASRLIPGSSDPWIVEEEEADLYAIIEEEILLNLPYVVYHETCSNPLAVSQEAAGIEQADKKNPFQVLEQLKATPKK